VTNVNYQQSMSPPLADNKYILHWLDCYHLHIAQRNLLLADNIKCYLVDCHSVYHEYWPFLRAPLPLECNDR